MSRTSRISSFRVVRGLLCALAFAGLAGALTPSAAAGTFTLTDGNTIAQFNTASAANHFNWIVDGVDQLAQQAFWYRIGNVDPEASVHAMPIAAESTSDVNGDLSPDFLFVRYNNGTGLQIETRYSVNGGAPGSGGSDLGEQIKIYNLTGSAMDFHFFQYADFDISGGPNFVTFTNANTVRQYSAGTILQETVVTPVPSHREGGLFPFTLNRLSDGLPTTLNDTALGAVVGPGDVTWAYQWDFLIAPNSSVQISKDKNLASVPEPATGSLLALAAGLLLAWFRKR